MFLLIPFLFLLMLVVPVIGVLVSAGRGGAGFAFGRVIANAFWPIGRAPLFLALSALIPVTAPQAIVTYFGGGGELSLATSMRPWAAVLTGVIAVVPGTLTQLLIMTSALDALEGERRPVRARIGAALARWLPGIVIVVAQWGALVGLGIAIALGASLTGAELLYLAVIPALVLGLFAVSLLSSALPVLLAEGGGVARAMARSVALSRGARFHLFLLTMMALFAQLVFATAAALFAVGFGIVAGALVSALTAIVPSIIVATGIAAVYHELRTAKEGAPAGELKRVFA